MSATMTRRQTGTGRAAAKGAGLRSALHSEAGAADQRLKDEGGRMKAELACPTGHDATGIAEKKVMSLASFFAMKRGDAAARGWHQMAAGYAGDLADIEIRGLLAQVEGRAA